MKESPKGLPWGMVRLAMILLMWAAKTLILNAILRRTLKSIEARGAS